MKKIQIAMLSAAAQSATVSLAAWDFGAAAVEVDEAVGEIRNCAVMTIGPTLGHPFAIDATTLLQARDLINPQVDGVKVRFKHPTKQADGTMPDDLGTVVGVLKPNTRIVGDVLRGDLRLGDYAANVPGLGDVRSYLLGIAKSDPTKVGLSVVMAWTPDRGSDGSIVARVEQVMACDCVGKAAANPNGLLAAVEPPEQTKPPAAALAADNSNGSAPQTRKGVPMDPKLKAHLVAMGMDPAASDEAAMAFHAGLSAATKAQLAAKCAAPTDAPGAKKDDDDDDAELSAIEREGAQIVALESKRVEQITQLGAVLKAPEAAVREQINKGTGVKAARVALLAAVAAVATPVSGLSGSVTVGRDAAQVAMLQAVPEAIAIRAGHAKVDKPHELAPKLASLSVIDMGRQYLAALGAKDVHYIARPRMAEILLSSRQLRREMPQVAMLAESVGDFPSLMLDAMHKTFRPLYLDAPKTWPQWVRKSSNPDFKNINRVALSEAGSLKLRDAGGQINYVALTDGKETYSLAEYVGGIKITRKAIINDDMDAFGRIPQLQSNSCWRAEEEAVYGILTANAALGVDGVTLFHSTHKNLITAAGSAAAPSVASMSANETAMITQKGPGGKSRLALRPKFVITPAALKVGTEQFLTSANLISVISTTSTAPQTVGQSNPYSGKLTHIWTPVLDDTSAVAWYNAADYRDGQIDTIEISFLDGESEPVLRQETDFDSEDVKFAVRHTLAAKAIDFRGLVKNAGA